MTKKELAELKKAVRSICKPSHSLRIEGAAFRCVWNGSDFIWTSPAGTEQKVDARDVVNWIGNGEYITDWMYDYVDE